MGQLWDAPAPQGCNFTPILRYGLTEPASLFKCGKFHIFCEILSLSYEASKFFAMLSLCVFFGCYFAPGAKHRTPDRLKSHSTPFPIRPHVLTPHSWLCGKNCGRIARRSLVRANSNYNTRMYISRRKLWNGACSGKLGAGQILVTSMFASIFLAWLASCYHVANMISMLLAWFYHVASIISMLLAWF